MLAIDMEIPKSCYDCPVHIINWHKHGGGSFCAITGDDTDCHWNREKRDDNCPLKEIITCKDCSIGGRECSNSRKYCFHIGKITEDDFYCPNAERRE